MAGQAAHLLPPPPLAGSIFAGRTRDLLKTGQTLLLDDKGVAQSWTVDLAHFLNDALVGAIEACNDLFPWYTKAANVQLDSLTLAALDDAGNRQLGCTDRKLQLDGSATSAILHQLIEGARVLTIGGGEDGSSGDGWGGRDQCFAIESKID